ncbi:hypothetical protein CR513_58868, partial [Mucuna pruriens]
MANEAEVNLEPLAELKRLVEQDENMIQPYKERVEIINLGCKEERKEVKIGTTIQGITRKELISLLTEYTYQYIPGLDSETYQPMRHEFSDEDIMALLKEEEDDDKEEWMMLFDRASNMLGHEIGVVLIPPEQQFSLSRQG